MFQDFFGFRFVRREDDTQAQQASSGADGVTNTGRTVHLYGSECLTVSAVYRAVDLISSGVASLKLERKRWNRVKKCFVLDETTDGRWENYLLNVKPNDYQNAFVFWKGVVTQRLLYGNAYVLPVWRDGYIEKLVLLRSNGVTYDYLTNTYNVTAEEYGISGATYPARSIWHFKNLSVDGGLTGISTIAYAARTIDVSATGESETLNRFASGGSFHAILQNNTASVGIGKYRDKSLKALSKDLQEAVNKGSNILVVPGDGKLTPYTMTSADLQFLESRKLTVRDIARFFNVPAALLMDDSGSNYNTMEQANIAFYSQALRPILCDIVGEITGKRLTERTAYEVKYTHDVSGIYTTDLKSRIDYEKGLLETGQATVNDLRRRNDTAPVDGGDTVYMSVQVQPLNQQQQEQQQEGGES